MLHVGGPHVSKVVRYGYKCYIHVGPHVLYVLGLRWIEVLHVDNEFHLTCVGILSSVYLLCNSMMVLCERRLHITSPIWAHRRTPYCNGVRESWEDSNHEAKWTHMKHSHSHILPPLGHVDPHETLLTMLYVMGPI